MKSHALTTKVFLFLVICSVALLSSCMFFINAAANQPALRILLPGSNSRAAAVPTVDYYLVTLSNGSETIGPEKYESGSVASFDELTVGTWKITVEAWFAGTLCGTGVDQVEVLTGSTAECAIALQLVQATASGGAIVVSEELLTAQKFMNGQVFDVQWSYDNSKNSITFTNIATPIINGNSISWTQNSYITYSIVTYSNGFQEMKETFYNENGEIQAQDVGGHIIAIFSDNSFLYNSYSEKGTLVLSTAGSNTPSSLSVKTYNSSSIPIADVLANLDPLSKYYRDGSLSDNYFEKGYVYAIQYNPVLASLSSSFPVARKSLLTIGNSLNFKNDNDLMQITVNQADNSFVAVIASNTEETYVPLTIKCLGKYGFVATTNLGTQWYLFLTEEGYNEYGDLESGTIPAMTVYDTSAKSLLTSVVTPDMVIDAGLGLDFLQN